MKIIRGFKVRGFILAAAFSAGLGFATSASAQVAFIPRRPQQQDSN